MDDAGLRRFLAHNGDESLVAWTPDVAYDTRPELKGCSHCYSCYSISWLLLGFQGRCVLIQEPRSCVFIPERGKNMWPFKGREEGVDSRPHASSRAGGIRKPVAAAGTIDFFRIFRFFRNSLHAGSASGLAGPAAKPLRM